MTFPGSYRYRMDGNVNPIDVDLSRWPSRHLVLAFAASHGIKSCIAWHCSSVAQSSDGLIHVDVPTGTHHVRLVYHNSLLLSFVLIALATFVVYLLLYRSYRSERSMLGPERTAALAENATLPFY